MISLLQISATAFSSLSSDKQSQITPAKFVCFEQRLYLLPFMKDNAVVLCRATSTTWSGAIKGVNFNETDRRQIL